MLAGAFAKLLGFARATDWWSSKIPPLLSVAYLAILLRHLEAHAAAPLLGGYLFSVCCVAVYGHVINDAFDVQADLQSGKLNAMAQLDRPERLGMCVTPLCAGFLPALVIHYSGTALCLLALNYLWPTLYSLPIVRLKERGLLGVVCDAMGPHIFPTLLALSMFGVLQDGAPPGEYDYPKVILLWAAALGLKGILHHQVLDRERDLRSGVNTFATSVGAAPIMRFLVAFNLGIELPISSALAFVVYRSCPFAAAALSIYCAVETIRFCLGDRLALAHDPAAIRRVIPFTNEMFYVSWLPMAAALQLAASDRIWWWLPLLHAATFYRTIIMQYSELACITRVAQARYSRPAGPSSTIEQARPLVRRHAGSQCEQEEVGMSKDWTILLFATAAMAEFVENALIGIKRCGIEADRVQVVFPASSEAELGPMIEAFAARPRILEHLVDVSPADIPESYLNWDTLEFNALLTYRFRVLRTILSEGYGVVCADADVSWLRNPLPYLSDVLERYPWACQIEPYAEFPPHFCLGFYALRATAETSEMIDLHIARNVGDALKQNDQTLFRNMLVENPRYLASVFPLPESLFPTGRLFRAVQFRDVAPPVPMLEASGPFIFHANWCTGLESKRRLLSHAGAWFGPTAEVIPDSCEAISDLHLNQPGVHAYDVPSGVGVLRILSERAFAPNDERPLGAAITRISIDGVDLRLDDPSLRTGFHLLENDSERTWRWTDGAAIVPIPVTSTDRKIEIESFAVAAPCQTATPAAGD